MTKIKKRENKYLQLVVAFILFSTSIFSQKQTQNWYFGRNAGLSFSTSPPSILLDGALNTFEGCATYSDEKGNLLFYTDGINVFNKNHQRMPNGTGLMGNPSSAQSGIIVPNPNSTTKYYLFTVDAEGQGNGFRYSEVDLSLNGGLGDVITQTKNTLLFAPSEEKIAAVRHQSIPDAVWVLSHGFGNNRFYAYLVTKSGIATPIISNIGSNANGGWGYLSVSPDGSKIACAFRYQGFEIFHFNSSTGVVSNPTLLSSQVGSYGVSFSPNNTILYGCNIETGAIFQWNLGAGSSSEIINSRIQIGIGQGNSYKGGAIQQGLDNRLYIPHYEQPFLSVINNPNNLGLGCDLRHSAINLQGRNASLGLPPFIQSLLCIPPNILQVQNQVVNAESQTTLISFQQATTNIQNVTYSWVNDNPSIGLASNGSGNILPFTAKNNPGSPVTATITVTPSSGSCIGVPITFTIIVNPSSKDIFIPNAFTPNSDGKNDELRVFGSFKEYTMYIYNQWGELIWISKQSSGWNGKANGKLQPSGVYTYVADITLFDQTKITKKGFINLIH